VVEELPTLVTLGVLAFALSLPPACLLAWRLYRAMDQRSGRVLFDLCQALSAVPTTMSSLTVLVFLTPANAATPGAFSLSVGMASLLFAGREAPLLALDLHRSLLTTTREHQAAIALGARPAAALLYGALPAARSSVTRFLLRTTIRLLGEASLVTIGWHLQGWNTWRSELQGMLAALMGLILLTAWFSRPR